MEERVAWKKPPAMDFDEFDSPQLLGCVVLALDSNSNPLTQQQNGKFMKSHHSLTQCISCPGCRT